MKLQKLNITDILTDIIKEITIRSESFSHIDAKKITVCLGSNRNNCRGAIYGKLVPLKFKDGSDKLQFRGRYYKIPEIMNEGIAQLYAVYFYLPKFFNLSAEEKLRVIFHELYHISPEFNGDIRRMGSVKKAHGSSRKKFDLKFEKEVKLFFKFISNTAYLDLLTMDSKSLQKNYLVYARRMKIPKPVPVNI
ncbi:MAG: putative metallopeptidase [Spirochaetota bacterium]